MDSLVLAVLHVASEVLVFEALQVSEEMLVFHFLVHVAAARNCSSSGLLLAVHVVLTYFRLLVDFLRRALTIVVFGECFPAFRT